MNKWTLGVVSDAIYYYRIRQGSLVDLCKKKKDYYSIYINNVVLWFYEKSMKQCGFFPKFLQYTLLRDMTNRVMNNTQVIDVLSDDEMQVYSKELRRAFSIFEDDTICRNTFLNSDYQLYIMSLKKAVPSVVYNEKNNSCVYIWKGRNIEKKPYCCFEHLSVKNGHLILEGYAIINNVGKECKNCLYAKINDTYVKLKEIDGDFDNIAYGREVVFARRHFILDHEIIGEKTNISLWFKYDDIFLPYSCLGFGKWFPINSKLKTAYYAQGGYLAQINDMKVCLTKASSKVIDDYESAYCNDLKLLSAKDEVAKKAIVLRRLYFKFKKLFRKPIWLVSDRHSCAGDNGQAFFEYLQKNRENIKSYFVIDGDCEAYKKLKKYRDIVKIESRKYKILTLFASALVSAHFDSTELFAFDYTYVKDIICQKKFIFLQHGIIKDDVSKYYSRSIQRLDMFLTSTHAEYQSIIENGNYLCCQGEAKLTGMPRFDKLSNQREKTILISPTWRNNLVRIIGTNLAPSIDNKFYESYYYEFYHTLLNDERLHETAKRYGYKIAFLPHFNIAPANSAFKDIKDVIFVEDRDRDYNTWISKCSLLVTDYSSIMFDVAYLHKPIVYCQGDKEEFFANHTYTKGYFSYEEDGFGDVTYNVEDAVNTICAYLANDCQIKNKYRDRIDTTYTYTDSNNSERVYNAILECEK